MLHKINQFFTNINSFDGFSHWAVQRLTALIMLCSVFVVIFFDNLYVFVFLLFFLVFHISLGIRTLIDDYIHDDILFLISTSCLRIITLFLLKTIIVLFIIC